MKKLLLALVVVAFMVTPALAGNQPEFDTVGCDATNYFNDFIRDFVCANGTVFTGTATIRINEYSSFPSEAFTQTAGLLLPDPCFNGLRTCLYLSALTDAFNQATYTWTIVLQKKPESDLNLNIRDCVLKHNFFDVWTECEQTGRWRAPWGELMFWVGSNPLITVTALPGQFAETGFPTNIGGGMRLDARVVPGLTTVVPLSDIAFTSKCLWEETVIVALPTSAVANASGQTQVNLKQGDSIRISIRIPPANTADIRYGSDNVSLKYIGVIGTEFFSTTFCGACGNPTCPPAPLPPI